MASLFGHGNPLATIVGQLVERATDGTQVSENWGLFMEICDKINETDEGHPIGRGAVESAFKVQLNCTPAMVAGPTQSVLLADPVQLYWLLQHLVCLETCVKNFGRRFHLQLANKDFLADLIKIIGPKYDPPQIVQEKVLSMIQTWADAFRGVPELKEVEKVYQDLKTKGIEFPMTDLDAMAPIHTLHGYVYHTAAEMETERFRIASNASVRAVTNELLRVNDDLNNVFLRYERFERYRTGQTTLSDQAPEHTVEPLPQDSHLPPSYEQVQACSNPSVGNLIDLGEDNRAQSRHPEVNNVQNKLLNLDMNSTAEPPGGPDQDFDMFAQSRQSFEQNSQTPSAGIYNNQQEDQLPSGMGIGSAVNSRTQPGEPALQDKETDYDEMEQWLATGKMVSDIGKATLYFDKFLQERLTQSDNLPSIPAATGQQQPRNSSRTRQLQKEEEESPLFAL
ncbi:hypothetical protein ScPMuIL_004356 [Solemya velum]